MEVPWDSPPPVLINMGPPPDDRDAADLHIDLDPFALDFAFFDSVRQDLMQQDLSEFDTQTDDSFRHGRRGIGDR